ncbi:MAG: bifunctional DNA-formamidopyrimidine glycosylase/DNA-(apurinic or apyrimidinic site) lyase [Thiomargarita sp.]|nr:bifunctional DNA-formamidopyrimidine glycosylase/DNA-(apurinic or apyrimidinic site) lyase [Thiomargarita sp.]
MPELPEVETVRKGLMQHIVGKTVEKVIIREKRLRWEIPELLVTVLPNQSIKTIHRRGKYLLLECTTGYILIHLGMSGNVGIMPVKTKIKKHDHLDIIFTDKTCLRYHDPRRFGCVLWLTDREQHPLLSNLGIEPLEKSFNGTYLYDHAQRRRLAVKNYIMNSHVVVGIGNIYASEALFMAKLNPKQPAKEITLAQYQQLAKMIKKVLKQAIHQGGTTLRDFTNSTGKQGYFKQQLQVYGRDNLPCVHCNTAIINEKIGQRSSYYCPICQQF